MKILGIIPARGGSKGIPRKNIINVGGKPLIAWTIETARTCNIINRLIVSTDDPEIADISKKYGADVPFLRPDFLSTDDTPGIEPVLHALKWIKEHERYQPDIIILLQPTSPLRNSLDILNSFTIMKEKNADSVISVSPVESHPYWTKQILNDGRLIDFIKVSVNISRRQDLPIVYSINGAIYLIKYDILIHNRSFYSDRTYAYIMPEERSMDIDTKWDIHLADLVLSHRNEL